MRKGIAAAALLAAGLRLALWAGLGDELEQWLKNSDGRMISASLSFELGAPAGEAAPETEGPAARAETLAAPAETAAVETPAPTETPVPEESPAPAETEPPELAPVAVAIDNDTSFAIDAQALLAQGLSQTLAADAPQILIIHTHGSEAYRQDPAEPYPETDECRTDDFQYNVVRVGDELTAALEEQGLIVIHDRALYDYPSYTGSYTRSGAAVEAYLEQYPSLAVVIDLHRDAIGSGESAYRTAAQVPGQESAQVMLLVGTGENGLAHPNWQENLKLALAMQEAMERQYPTLARPLALKKERYNQQLTTGSLILEVGSTGNRLEEAVCAARLFGQAVGPVLLSLVE